MIKSFHMCVSISNDFHSRIGYRNVSDNANFLLLNTLFFLHKCIDAMRDVVALSVKTGPFHKVMLHEYHEVGDTTFASSRSRDTKYGRTKFSKRDRNRLLKECCQQYAMCHRPCKNGSQQHLCFFVHWRHKMKENTTSTLALNERTIFSRLFLPPLNLARILLI